MAKETIRIGKLEAARRQLRTANDGDPVSVHALAFASVSASTTLPWPPSGPTLIGVIASRMRWHMNHALLYVMPSNLWT